MRLQLRPYTLAVAAIARAVGALIVHGLLRPGRRAALMRDGRLALR